MENLRLYGASPYTVALVHGGPGACGEMAPVAKELASSALGVLEPMQTKLSLDGQVEELKEALEDCATLPLPLIGHSWGAWLSYLVAARYPTLVSKLIIVGSGPFEDQYAANLSATRLDRLSQTEQAEYQAASGALGRVDGAEQTRFLMRIGELTAKADSYNPVDDNPLAGVDLQPEQFHHVWPEAAAMRSSGTLLALGKQINCPVVAIHGDHDPHPADGVRIPLAKTVSDFRFILLKRCGHTPWREQEARKQFFDILRHELASAQLSSSD